MCIVQSYFLFFCIFLCMRLVVVCCVEARMFHKSEEEEKVRVERGKGRVEYALAKVYAFYICRSIDAVK
jgi:hypothetical protein